MARSRPAARSTASSGCRARCIPAPPSGSRCRVRCRGAASPCSVTTFSVTIISFLPAELSQSAGSSFLASAAGRCFLAILLTLMASFQSPISEPCRLLVSIPVQSSYAAVRDPVCTGPRPDVPATDLQRKHMKTKAALAWRLASLSSSTMWTSKGPKRARSWWRSRRPGSATPTGSPCRARTRKALFPAILGHEGAGIVVEVGAGREVAEEGRPCHPALHAGMPRSASTASAARPISARRSARPRARA